MTQELSQIQCLIIEKKQLILQFYIAISVHSLSFMMLNCKYS
jgi:hypothetical protein